jgi:predicted aspartyl protease
MAPLHDVSRRRFLKYGAFSLAFASVIGRARCEADSRDVAGPSDTAVPERDASPIIATNDTANHLTITVRIDDNGPYRFVVDTGADRTVLATDVAAELGLLFSERVMLQGVVRAVKTETVRIRELSFGSVRCRYLNVPTLPRSTLGADGYLGLDTLDGHRVTFDFKNHTLQVSAPHSRLSTLWVRDNEARIRTVGSSGHLRALNCVIDGVRAAAFIDSGADLSAGNMPLFTALAARNPAYGEIGTVSLVDVTGGETMGNVTMVKKIKIMELEFTDCPLVISDFKVFDVWGLTQRPALLIGMNFLRQFSNVSIDYGLKELRFDRASLDPPLPALTAALFSEN